MVLRTLVLGLVAGLFYMAWAGAASDPRPALVHAHDLVADARSAAADDKPLLLMFSSEPCPYCRIVEDEFLRPMLISGEYDDKVVMRKVKLDGYSRIRDFEGREVRVDELAKNYGVRITPTVVMVDAKGRQLAPSLEGIATRDYYGGDLDRVIDQALVEVRGEGSTLSKARAAQ
ncbi:thioredoxin family protein [Ectothiorhodospiraceae bacterium 2226]|nr:thioredoxin family protein [Ectothiorhodospiraceae bacterium 2226]